MITTQTDTDSIRTDGWISNFTEQKWLKERSLKKY